MNFLDINENKKKKIMTKYFHKIKVKKFKMLFGSILFCSFSQILHLFAVFMQIHSKSLNSPKKLLDRQTFRFSLLILGFSSLFAYFTLRTISILIFVNFEIVTIVITIILAHTSFKTPFPIALSKNIKVLAIEILLFLIFSYFDSSINLGHVNQKDIIGDDKNSINTTSINSFENDFKNAIHQISFPDYIQITIKVIIVLLIILFDFLSTRKIQRKNTRKFIFLSFGLSISYLTFTFKTLATMALNEETNLLSKRFVRFLIEFSIAFVIYAYELTKILYYIDSSDLIINGFITFYLLMIFISILNRMYLSLEFQKSLNISENSKASKKKNVSLFSKISFVSSKTTFSIFGFFVFITAFCETMSINALLKKTKSLAIHRSQLVDPNNLSHELFTL